MPAADAGRARKGNPEPMIRKLLFLPVAAVALLAGCATYGYRSGGAGDYYYGQPSADYGYYGSYGYGYPGYSGYYSYGYGAPYWGGSIGYYRYYVPSRHWHGDGHDHGGGHHGGHDGHDGHGGGGDHTPDRPRPPWRDLGSVAGSRVGKRYADAPEGVAQPPRPMLPRQARPVQEAPRPPRVGGWKRDDRRIPAR
jgi:hypothetical protein